MTAAGDKELGLGDLAVAERVLDTFERASMVTDEAELLRGCLYALVAIGRHLYDHPAPGPVGEPVR